MDLKLNAGELLSTCWAIAENYFQRHGQFHWPLMHSNFTVFLHTPTTPGPKLGQACECTRSSIANQLLWMQKILFNENNVVNILSSLDMNQMCLYFSLPSSLCLRQIRDGRKYSSEESGGFFLKDQRLPPGQGWHSPGCPYFCSPSLRILLNFS